MKRIWVAVLFWALSLEGALCQNWSQFRGPASHGVSGETGLPLHWSPEENIFWKAALPGPGHSSPVIWEDRIFLTTFAPTATSRLISLVSSSQYGRLLVLSLERQTGRIVWQREVEAGEVEKVHRTNSPASPTPVTDGTNLYVYFGSFGLVCFDFQGNKKWEHPLGPFPNAWGSASSPILYRDMLLLNCDTDGSDFLLALDKKTGKAIWRTSRDGANRAWPTPYIWHTENGIEVVVSGSHQARSYDPRDGSELWWVDGLTRWVTPTPVSGHGLLYLMAGGPGDDIGLAVRPGGRGNITDTHVAWRFRKGIPYNPSPVLVGAYLYTVKKGGTFTCLDARSGKLVYQKRLPAPGDYFASPLASEGKIYTLSEDGETCIVEEGPEFKIIGTGSVGERCMGSPAASHAQLFIRSDESLFCIGGPRP